MVDKGKRRATRSAQPEEDPVHTAEAIQEARQPTFPAERPAIGFTEEPEELDEPEQPTTPEARHQRGIPTTVTDRPGPSNIGLTPEGSLGELENQLYTLKLQQVQERIRQLENDLNGQRKRRRRDTDDEDSDRS